ncbi:nucleoside-diphosphate-sugar epimerase [Tricharina praecox]|uniref:nucleoside-diphosphate-sugar epimerase n=1 Tax=Tricharina praecox TaxID=43433 RepID=UPI002220DF4D|nr:nucleoside-diphosphate-sugar epimerase [Tricharina praecox]KAI5851803.1 nucleoside-diphosphate-sugar epimerase [Tricharina praecox]
MAPKFFLTGVTGYIGGSVFARLASTHPEYEITVLLRSVPDGFKEKYPNVKIVKGDFDSADIITAAAENADIVIHAGNSDHVAANAAILAGLSKSKTPTYLLHLSGTGTVADFTSPDFVPGAPNPKIWSDVSDLPTISTFPLSFLHRPVDSKILSAASTLGGGGNIRTAIVAPPAVYGRGSGPRVTQSFAIPFFVEDVQKFGGRTFYIGDGANEAAVAHIDDVAAVFVKLAEIAVAGGEGADWNEKGYYFVPVHQPGITWKSVAAAVGKSLKARGIIKNAEPISVGPEDTDKMIDGSQIGLYIYGSNSKIRADRATTLLGLEAKAPGFFEVLEEDLDDALNDKQRDSAQMRALTGTK